MKKIMTIVIVAVMLQLAVVSMASAAPPASGPDGHRYTPNYGYNYNYNCNYNNCYNRYRPVVRYPAYRPAYNYYYNGYCCYCYPTYNRAYYGKNYTYNRYYW